MVISRSLLYLFLLFSLCVNAQKLRKADKITIGNLQSHIKFLSSDQLEGRRAGTKGEKLAMEYISAQFAKIGLTPKGDDATYYQKFSIWEGKNFEEKSSLFINDDSINMNAFFPLPGSPVTSLESLPSIGLRETGVPWFLDIREDLLAQKNNPHFDLTRFLAERAKNAFQKGATGLFVYDSATAVEPEYNPKQKMDSLPIPVIFIKSDIAKKYFNDETEVLNIKLKVEFTENIRTAHNVIGYIDNHSATTAIVGAHYDHLGFGEDGNSLMTPGKRLIHRGADDNASGIAALIELSRLLKASALKNNNYLIVAFSGEELGLFGSKFFVSNPPVDLASANYMINMDMIGRLDENTKTLIVGGYGTSPAWSAILKKAGVGRNFVPRYDSSGAGPSDHTSFYEKDIPVLFFFTGIHGDYHKPTDEAAKINYTGEYQVLQYIIKVIEAANKSGKLAFTPTRNTFAQTNSTFSVTLGIRPDYGFNGNGVRVDAVSAGRAAEQAGLKLGDVVVQLGDFPITTLEDYMQALNNFKKGDKTTVKVKRANDTIEAEVSF